VFHGHPARASERAIIRGSILLSRRARRNFALFSSLSLSLSLFPSIVFSFLHHCLCHREGETERESRLFSTLWGTGVAAQLDSARRWYRERSISLSRQRTMHFGETYGRHSLKVRSSALKPGYRRVVSFVVVVIVAVIVNIRAFCLAEKKSPERLQISPHY